MARPNITAVHRKAMANLSRINTFLQKSQSIPPSMRGFVAEILMLRLLAFWKKVFAKQHVVLLAELRIEMERLLHLSEDAQILPMQ